ncbi:NgoPII family restriction endonuclease [Pseudanabaena mucicola]|uniref:NgoPII family restriction endonuclease n=1 Tax=Pseudanabaena mucicola FACHB-723 TaxID=2692860 RepID=A0ABR7ZXD3_9CYAN|nr:NgoPII family restriction endonuclease [Pseudanabaena mucicola]MBD2188507.1 NgoPII family restriction endonuclease [Pseudanabaena mucicola FACHB-723]
MTNLLTAIINIVNNNQLSLTSYFKSNNRINAVGDGLEFFIKDAFCNSFNLEIKQKSVNVYPQFFSYEGNSNNPPDLILKDGDAVEVKKIESLKTAIALNSSYPKAQLFANDSMITNACRSCENAWKVKDIIYTIGVVPKQQNRLKFLWFVYGDCFAAEKQVYERIRNGICDGVNQIAGIEFAETNELARVNRVDPLGITYLRVRGMWGIENPISIYNYLDLEYDESCNFQMIAIMQESKYLSFSKQHRQAIENLADTNQIKIRDIKIKSPNNPAKILNSKIIIYKK